MTNAPSMTITSTTPAPEGSNSTSREGKAIPPPAPDTPPPDMVKTVGGTTFDIYFHFSQTSRETFTDKVLRLKIKAQLTKSDRRKQEPPMPQSEPHRAATLKKERGGFSIPIHARPKK